MKIFIQKLGCPKNDVDADYIAARLIEAGHRLVDDPLKADTVVVNTCGFVSDAKEESVDYILQLARLKKTGKLKQLFASGCLSQRYGDEMLTEMPELDGAFGLGALDALADAVGGGDRPRKAVRQDVRKLAYLDWKSRAVTDRLPYAYVKISDGCDRKCSYCAIPQMRGKYRSRPAKSILNEVRFLAEQGKKELILVSQEATLWGSDLAGQPSLVKLLDTLAAVKGVEWIRLLYLHPARTDTRLIEWIGGHDKAVPYFDLPLQHVNTDVLRRMKRESNRKTIERLLAEIGDRAPKATLRVSFMVGFPGETKAQFKELCEFAVERRFDRLGVFAFSPEEGTTAAALSPKVSSRVKAERMDRLMTLQQAIAFEKNNSLIGTEVDVIIDSAKSGGQAIGRTPGDCPEIDQIVSVRGRGLKVGSISRVKITGADGYDLTGMKVTAKR